jgi:hypothetical protein
MGVPKGLYIQQRDIPFYARRSEFIWSKTSYAGEWNIVDSINAELIVIGIEHGNDKRMAS